MASEVRCKSGNYTYLYESISFRNKDGEPRNTRKIIGKVDPVTGAKLYKQEYVQRMLAQGTPVEIAGTIPSFSIDDIKNSVAKEFGLTRLSENQGKKPENTGFDFFTGHYILFYM